MTIGSNRVMFIFFLIGNIHPLSFPRNDKKLNHKFSGIIFCRVGNVFLLPTEMVGKMVGKKRTLPTLQKFIIYEIMQFLPDNGEKQAYLNEISKRLSVGAKFILVDLEGDQCSDNFNLLMSAWKAHQYGTREDTEQVKVDFEHINRDLHFVPSMRIEALLNNAGFTEVQKFYKAYLFGGYIATKQ